MNEQNFQMYMMLLFIGLAIVLIAIIVLIWKISCQSKAIYSMQKKNEQIVTDRVMNNEIPEEVIAAISAAVYTLYGNVSIKSIHHAERPAHSAWAMAGLLDNTRPF